jgi:hypothetical protein
MRYWKPRYVPGGPKVGIAVASYLNEQPRRHASLMCLLYALQAQTWHNWQCIVMHDGHCKVTVPKIDPRITFVQAEERKGNHGHPHRQATLNRLLDADCTWLLMTNDDNYYAPVFLEWMLMMACNPFVTDLVYCNMIHSHKLWQHLHAHLRRGSIDLGSFMIHKDLARQIQFDDYSFAGDWAYLEKAMQKTEKQIRKIPATLFVHN